MIPILCMDIVDGKRMDVPPARPSEKPTLTQSRILEHGPELILRKEPYEPTPGLETFGDKSRLSASLMLAPLRKDEKPTGILNIQSYSPNAYRQDDLATFQALADHVAGALERIWTQKALQESEKRFRLIAENAQDIIYRYEFLPQPRFAYVSPASTRIIGYSPEEHYADPELGRKLIHPDFSEPLTLRWRHKDGRTVWTEQRNVAIFDERGNLAAIEGIARDVTERKRAEEALRESEKKFRDLVENSLVGVYVIQDGIFRYVNPKLAEIFGYESDQLIGKKGPMDLTHPQYRPIVENNIAKRLSGEIRSVRYEFKGITRDEKVIDVEVHGSGTLYDGKPAVVGTLLDVSESKRSQESLRDSSQRLERLSHRLLEVQEAERRGLARELHDQVGQALTALKINIQSVQRLSDPANLRARLHESIAIVDQTIDQVRSLSLDLRPSLLDDLGLVPALRWYLDRTAQRAELKANFTAEPLESRPSPEIETACFRVAQEALTNVIRHAHARRIEVMLRHTNDLLELIVHDDGGGFDVGEALKKSARGESLGLTGMKERVELTGGQFLIRSSSEGGTVVQARFPMQIAIASKS